MNGRLTKIELNGSINKILLKISYNLGKSLFLFIYVDLGINKSIRRDVAKNIDDVVLF